MMHPRLSVSAMSTFNWTFEQDLALWKEMGLRHAGLLISKLDGDAEAKLAQLDDAGISISTLIVGGFDLSDRSSWQATRDSHARAIDMVAEHDGHSIYFTSGRTVRCDWNEDFDLLCEAVGPSVAHGKAHDVLVALEPTTRTNVSFVTTLDDAIDVAKITDLSIVADVANIWTERNLAETLREAIPFLALMQIGDVVIGSSKCPPPGGRVHIGDGDLPVQSIVDALIAGGYEGLFDLEVVGAELTQSTDPDKIRTGIRSASRLLEETLHT